MAKILNRVSVCMSLPHHDYLDFSNQKKTDIDFHFDLWPFRNL